MTVYVIVRVNCAGQTTSVTMQGQKPAAAGPLLAAMKKADLGTAWVTSESAASERSVTVSAVSLHALRDALEGAEGVGDDS